MAGELSFGAGDPFDLQSIFSAAQTAGADQTFTTPRTSDTVTTNAIDGAAPIDNGAGSAWGGFWRDTLGAVVGYAIARDTQKHAVPAPAQPATPAAVAVQQASATPRWLLPAAIAGGALLLIVVLRK